jgi:hypothetical protein
MATMQTHNRFEQEARDIETLELVDDYEDHMTSYATDYEDDEYFDEPLGFLGFMMRGRSVQSIILDRIQATPCWIVSLSLHVAALLVLASFTVGIGDKRIDDVILDVSINRDTPKVIDLAKIRQVFSPSSVTLQDSQVPLAPPLNPAEVEETPVELDIELDYDMSYEIIPDEDFITVEGDIGEELAAAIGSQAMGFGGSKLGNGGADFNGRGLNGYASIVQNLGKRMHAASKKFHSRVVMIWLVDRSVSMKDDQAAIREQLWEMDQRFREEGTGRLRQSVVAFGKRPNVILKPVEDVQKVMEAFDRIKSSEPGTPENVNAALIYCTKLFKNTRGIKKVVVLVDDDSGDDNELTEEAIKALKNSGTTLYVINRESPFQETEGYENYSYTDMSGEQFKGTGTVRRGPETALIEVPRLRWGAWNWPNNWSSTQVLSGFGIYDQSRAAFHTGGAYYILNPESSGSMSSEEFDWVIMEHYRPELLTRSTYQRRVRNNPFRKAIVQVEQAWNSKDLRIRLNYWSPDLLEQNIQRTQARLALLERMIPSVENKAIMPTSRLQNLKSGKRWVANADLTLSQLYLARYRLRQYLYAQQDFTRRAKDIPDDHAIVWQHNLQPRRTPEEARDRQDCVRIMRFLATRHEGTPWGKIGADFDPDSTLYLHGYRLRHKPAFNPFTAIIEFKNGKKIEAKVTKMTKKEVSYQNKKGTKTTPRSETSKITPLDKQNVSDRPRI